MRLPAEITLRIALLGSLAAMGTAAAQNAPGTAKDIAAGGLRHAHLGGIVSVPAIRERLQSHTVEVLMIGRLDYLQLESASSLIAPVATDARSFSGGTRQYVVVANAARDYYRLAGPPPNRLAGSGLAAAPAESNLADRGKERY